MRGFREVTMIRVRRHHINPRPGASDKYGHWWIEIGDPMSVNLESYGWWPRDRVGLRDALAGVQGELNGQTSFAGEPSRDPHHGDVGGDTFHPFVLGSDSRSDSEIAECLREFARSYSGEWKWVIGWGQNCHSFQKEAFRHCRLREPAALKKGKS